MEVCDEDASSGSESAGPRVKGASRASPLLIVVPSMFDSTAPVPIMDEEIFGNAIVGDATAGNLGGIAATSFVAGRI